VLKNNTSTIIIEGLIREGGIDIGYGDLRYRELMINRNYYVSV
jgi:hypothetical protein